MKKGLELLQKIHAKFESASEYFLDDFEILYISDIESTTTEDQNCDMITILMESGLRQIELHFTSKDTSDHADFVCEYEDEDGDLVIAFTDRKVNESDLNRDFVGSYVDLARSIFDMIDSNDDDDDYDDDDDDQ